MSGGLGVGPDGGRCVAVRRVIRGQIIKTDRRAFLIQVTANCEDTEDGIGERSNTEGYTSSAYLCYCLFSRALLFD